MKQERKPWEATLDENLSSENLKAFFFPETVE
jgi:hypothetical protein